MKIHDNFDSSKNPLKLIFGKRTHKVSPSYRSFCQLDTVSQWLVFGIYKYKLAINSNENIHCSLCELVSVAARQKGGSADTDNTLAQMLSWLWNLVGVNKHLTVVDAALM